MCGQFHLVGLFIEREGRGKSVHKETVRARPTRHYWPGVHNDTRTHQARALWPREYHTACCNAVGLTSGGSAGGGCLRDLAGHSFTVMEHMYTSHLANKPHS